jgi:hypothetical protein
MAGCGDRLGNAYPVYAGAGNHHVPAATHGVSRNPRSALDSFRTAMVST